MSGRNLGMKTLYMWRHSGERGVAGITPVQSGQGFIGSLWRRPKTACLESHTNPKSSPDVKFSFLHS